MPSAFQWLILVVWCSCLAVSRGEDAACPCINPWTSTNTIPENLSFWDGATQCLAYRPSPAGERYCYPPTYGTTGCFAHDVDLPPDCVDDGTSAMAKSLPAFCSDPWCYVDANNCKVDFEKSSYFPSLPLFYSYATCGALNSFTEAKMATSMAGRSFRVGVPGMEYPFLYRDALTGKLSGLSPDLLVHIAKEHGFTMTLKPVFNDSKTIYPQSSYTACVRDVALGRFDFCTGVYWETPQRRALATFAPMLYPETWWLVVYRQEKKDGFFDILMRVFAPFSPSLWATVLSFSLVVGTLLWLFGEFDHVHPFSGLSMAVEMAILKFLGQTGWGRLHTVGSGMVGIGFGFVCMVGMASYMANTAAMLVATAFETSYESLEDAISKDAQICVLEAIKGPLLAKYPGAGSSIVYTAWFDESIAKMDAGECDAMLLNENEYHRMLGGVEFYGTSPAGKAAHCNKVKVGDTALIIATSFPVHKHIVHEFSYFVTKGLNDGVWDRSVQSHTAPVSRCQALQAKKVGALTPNDLSGALSVATIFIILGTLCHYGGPVVERFFVKTFNQCHRGKSGDISGGSDSIVQSAGGDEQSAPFATLERSIASLLANAAQLQEDFAAIRKDQVAPGDDSSEGCDETTAV